jgi:hypothetical protein
VPADERTLAFLHELERADEAVAATLGELDELTSSVDSVRRRAEEADAFRRRFPAERSELDAALAGADELAANRRTAAAAAERELEEAGASSDRERIAAARRNAVRQRDALHVAERQREELAARRAALEQRAGEVEKDVSELETRAGELASALAARPRLAEDAGTPPEPELAGVLDWASRARAGLFVARGGLTAERDAVVRQANELGALVLGEPLTAGGPAAVARRIEGRSNSGGRTLGT